MPRTKQAGKTPANKQIKKKKCSCCGQEKKTTEFYASANPLYSSDKRIPICKICVRDLCIDDDTGEINEVKLNQVLKSVQKPYFKDDLASAYSQFAKEHSYIAAEDVKKYGDKILGLYFKNTMLRQNKDLSYDDSERMGFIHQNSNIPRSEKDKIAKKYADIQLNCDDKDSLSCDKENVRWSKKDKQNMKYVISTVGYDPFEDIGLDEYDRKYCFNIMSGYCDTDGITDDGHKMQGVIEMTMLYCQCRRITEAMNIELSKADVNDTKIQKLTSSKSSLLSSISKIAQDNNIASNFNKNSKQGQNSLTSKMKEMSEHGFAEIEVNLFDIKTAEAFRQIDEISNTNIANQLTLDAAEYSDIIKEQREMIQKYDSDIESLKEENRVLKNKIIDLENKKGVI